MTRPPSPAVGKKDFRQTAGDFLRHLPQVHEPARSCWTLYPHLIAVEEVIALQGFDQKIIHRQPNWSTPVRIPAEKPSVRFGGHVIHPPFIVIETKDIRVVPMHFREGADPVRREKLVLVEHRGENSLQTLASRNRKQAMV